MEARKIKPEEKILTELVDCVAFLGTMDADYKDKLARPRDHSEGYEILWGGFNDAGKMVSCVYDYDFSVRFDGHTAGMCGIGGVASLPEARTGGSVRNLLTEILNAARANGKVFSFLYPFAFEFYRKFGYELCYQHNRITAPVKNFREYKFPEGMSAYASGDDLTPYIGLYENFIKDKNLAVERDGKLMKERFDFDPYLSRKYGYLHRDGDGTPDAYIVYAAEDKVKSEFEQSAEMIVQELIWTTPEALHAMFGFIGGLSAQFKTIRWDAPLCVNPAAMFSDNYAVTVTRPAYGMNRVVNAGKAFELMKAPAGSGGAVIEVEDKFLTANSGVYQLEWENGTMTKVTQSSSIAPPDLETDVETLAQLVTGFMDFESARHKRGVKVHGNAAVLKALFPRKDLCIYNHF